MGKSKSNTLNISDNAALYVGGFYGLGEKPENISLTDLFLDPNALSLSSEFGFYPTMFFTPPGPQYICLT